MTTKVCIVCKVDKPLSEYHNDRNKKDGKSSSCKPCATARAIKWAEENPDRVDKNKRNYYERNIENVKAAAKEWRSSNPEAAQKSVDKYQIKNREKLNQLSKQRYLKDREYLLKYYEEYRSKNKQLCKVRVRRSQQKNPLRIRLQKYKRRDRVGDGKVSTKRVKELIVLQSNRCVYCDTELLTYHVDHIRPLAKGGTNTDDNIQLLCPPCNRKKGIKYPYDPSE